MKKYTLLFLTLCSFIAVEGCTNAAIAPSTTAATVPTSVNTNILNQYSWQLVKATDAQGQRIQTLFLQADKPVTLHFENNHLRISNACNGIGGSFSLTDNQLTVSRLVSTMMACPNHLNDIDTSISKLIEGTTQLQLSQSTAAPQLTLTTKQHDVLIWQGIATPETKYGSQGKTIFLEIAPQRKTCDAGAAPMQCLQVRQIRYNEQGVKTYTSDWQNFYAPIEGYTHADNERVILRVKEYPIAHPAADASSAAYVLDMYVERALVK